MSAPTPSSSGAHFRSETILFELPGAITMELRIVVDSKGKEQVECDLCGTLISLGPHRGTSSFSRHRSSKKCGANKRRAEYKRTDLLARLALQSVTTPSSRTGKLLLYLQIR
jgi:hypothetical protein